MSETIYHIYDKMFKKILTLSSTAVINLINGLFDTDYPTDSTITYNWTEFEDDNLRKTLADTILTINNKYSYHMEAQITEDDDIIFRVFDYSFRHADRNRAKGCKLIFPEPKIIYLCSGENTPDEYSLTLDFGLQGTFTYKVSTFKFLETSVEELNRKKMIILIPFQLLKLQSLLSKNRSKENLEALKILIQNDIIGNINANLALGNITAEDAQRLRRLTHRLYQHIYSHYDEMEEELNEMTDESLILDVDIVLKELHEQFDAKEAKLEAEITAKLETELTAKLEAEITAKLEAKMEAKMAAKDAEIAHLKAQLEELLKNQK